MIVHFSAHISKWELVCKFGVIFHIFIISCLCSRFHVRNQWFFYSVITFSYIKCFVHSYTVDVVFTLSYDILTVQCTFGSVFVWLCAIINCHHFPSDYMIKKETSNGIVVVSICHVYSRYSIYHIYICKNKIRQLISVPDWIDLQFIWPCQEH